MKSPAAAAAPSAAAASDTAATAIITYASAFNRGRTERGVVTSYVSVSFPVASISPLGAEQPSGSGGQPDGRGIGQQHSLPGHMVQQSAGRPVGSMHGT